MSHPRSYRDALERFRRGLASREDSREVVQHLLRGCKECRKAVTRVFDLRGDMGSKEWVEASNEPEAPDYSGAFARANRVVQQHQLGLAEEGSMVPEILAELTRHPRPRQEVLVSNSSRFHVWALVDELLEWSRRNCQPEPHEAEHRARLAVRLSQLLDPGRYGALRIQDLQSRAWRELGNVLRVQERYCEAERAFGEAEAALNRGTGDPLERAAVLSLQASLWRDRRQFEKALSLLDRTIAMTRRVGETQLQGIALIQKAQCHNDWGRPEVALPLLLEAQGLLDPNSDPRLLFVIQQSILFALTQAGRFEEAAAGLEDTKAFCHQLDYPIDRIRLEYVEGVILHGLQRLEDAETCFRSALQGMLDEDLHYDAALVGLDLAALLAQQNRHSEVRELAAAMLPVFTSHRIHREAIAALLVFQEAVQREKLSAQLAEELSTYLRNAASDPQLRFQPPAWLKSSKS